MVRHVKFGRDFPGEQAAINLLMLSPSECESLDTHISKDTVVNIIIYL